LVMERGEHLGIYHVGTSEEVTIRDLANRIARLFGREIRVVPGELARGGTARRCPDIAKVMTLGYRPRVALDDGLPLIKRWYEECDLPQING
jgi:nucleoside-diphosphate-sugar epimerase